MSLFQYIAQACQSLAATAAPSITAMGIHIVLALATIMMVWFGVQEALASAHGGAGFSMGRFLNLFMLLTFAYVMVNYYDSSIPGLGFSIKGFIDGGTINLVNLIGSDGSNTMLNEINAASSKTGPGMLNTLMSPYYALVYFAVQFLLALLAAIVSAIVAYGAIAATITRTACQHGCIHPPPSFPNADFDESSSVSETAPPSICAKPDAEQRP